MKFTKMKNVLIGMKSVLASIAIVFAFAPSFASAQFMNLSVTCYPGSTINLPVGGTVNLTAQPAGGNGIYTYYWQGDEGLSSGNQSVSKSYTTTGTKLANVTVGSNGQTVTAHCTVYVYDPAHYPATVYYPYSNYPINQNHVLGSNVTPNLNSVYLNNVPSTGLFDDTKEVIFIYSLVFFSLYVTYLMFKRKYNIA